MNRNRYPVSVMCQFFGISRSGYYDYVKRLGKPTHNLTLVELIREQQEKCDKTYGYRRMWKWLEKVKNGDTFYILSNVEYERAFCLKDGYGYNIRGEISREEILLIIDSLYR